MGSRTIRASGTRRRKASNPSAIVSFKKAITRHRMSDPIAAYTGNGSVVLEKKVATWRHAKCIPPTADPADNDRVSCCGPAHRARMGDADSSLSGADATFGPEDARQTPP